MISYKSIRADVSQEMSYVYEKVKQYDNLSRKYRIMITDKGNMVSLKGNEAIRIRMWADGESTPYIDKWLDEPWENGYPILIMTSGMLSKVGKVKYEFVIQEPGSPAVISTRQQNLLIQKSLINYDGIIASEDFDVLSHLIGQATTIPDLINDINVSLDDVSNKIAEVNAIMVEYEQQMQIYATEYDEMRNDMQDVINALHIYMDDIENETASSARLSESWAIGGTNSRDGEATNNSKFHSDQSKLYSDTAKESADRAEQFAGTVDPKTLFQINAVDTSGILGTPGSIVNSQYLVDKLSNNVKASKVFITPEEYGAIGDGVVDDTVALQNAINYCQTNTVRLMCLSGKKYLISQPIYITALCYIDFNSSEITTNDDIDAMIIVDAATVPGRNGFICNVVLNCAYIATAGIEIKRNINVITFENIYVNDPLIYGIYGNGGFGKFKNIIIRNRQGGHLGIYGLYTKSPDGVVEGLMTVNCQYGAYVSAMTQFINFHPWNSFSELMTNSVGIISDTTSITISDSYIDTCALCIENRNNGYVFITNSYFFWSTEYYTDDRIGSSDMLPAICTIGTRTNLLNCRIYKPLGTAQQKFKYATVTNVTKQALQESNLYEGLQNEPTVFCNYADVIMQPGFSTTTANPLIRRNKRVNLEIIIDVTNSVDLTTVGRTPVFSIPDGYRPAANKTFMGMVGNATSANRLCYCYFNASTNFVYLLPIDKKFTFGEIIYIDCEYDNFIM